MKDMHDVVLLCFLNVFIAIRYLKQLNFAPLIGYY